MDIRLLRYFLAVATNLNFGRAAAELHTAQPSLSQQIRKLEHELGGPLFERTKRHVALTPLGMELLPAARAIVDELERVTRRMRDCSATIHSPLHIATIGPAALGVVPLFLSSYRRAYPDVELHLSTVDLDAQIRALLERRIDVGVLRGPLKENWLHTLPLADEYFCVMMADDHPLARRDVVRIRDLHDIPLVLLDSAHSGSFSETIQVLFERHGVKPSRIVEAPDVQAVFALIASGVGAGLSSTIFCPVAITGLAYRSLLPKTQITTMMLACRKDRREVPVIRSLFDHASSLRLVFPPPTSNNHPRRD